MKKIKYEKPKTLDAGNVAAIFGARCSNGNLADPGGCVTGFNADTQTSCDQTGASATNNCQRMGSSAGIACTTGSGAIAVCFSVGNSPNP